MSNMYPGQQMHAQVPLGYNDTILSITQSTTPDPYVIFVDGVYYMTWTAGNRVEIWSADALFDFEQRCRKVSIWQPPENNQPYSGDIWAPELHSLHGKWYVYFAATDPALGNKSHRMFVLTGPPSSSSPLEPSSWSLEGSGRLTGLPDTQWAIDGTVITLNQTLYFVYSGWPLGTKSDESKQELYIIRMTSPTTCTGTPTRISTPDHKWEYSKSSGINEGPQFLSSPDGTWTGIVYSCAGSWTSEYKMGVLEYNGGNPVHSDSWRKWPKPLLTCSRDGSAPYGPGHGNFVDVLLGSGAREVWGVFHATDNRTDGWANRRARVMRVGWDEKGPHMGRGECGFCCEKVEHFLNGPPEGMHAASSGGGGGGGGLGRELKGLVNRGKGFLGKFM